MTRANGQFDASRPLRNNPSVSGAIVSGAELSGELWFVFFTPAGAESDGNASASDREAALLPVSRILPFLKAG